MYTMYLPYIPYFLVIFVILRVTKIFNNEIFADYGMLLLYSGLAQACPE